MSKKKEESTDQSGFPEKLLKKLPTGFTENIDSADTDEVKKKIFEAEKHIYATEIEKEQDQMLNAAKETVKDLTGPYRETTATENAKIRYCMYVLETRGVVVGKS